MSECEPSSWNRFSFRLTSPHRNPTPNRIPPLSRFQHRMSSQNRCPPRNEHPRLHFASRRLPRAVRKQGFERRRRILKRGDRVAVIGRGIAIVRMIYEGQVCAVLSNQTVLEIGRKQIVWDEANMRWEANYSGVSRTDRAG